MYAIKIQYGEGLYHLLLHNNYIGSCSEKIVKKEKPEVNMSMHCSLQNGSHDKFSQCYSLLNSPPSPIHPKKKLFGIFIASFIVDL